MSPPVPQRTGSWRSARSELAIAAATLVAGAIAAYAVAGGSAAVLVVVVFSAIAVVVVNCLLPAGPDPPAMPEVATDRRASTGLFGSHWRWRVRITDAMSSLPAYNAGLGPRLEHLLATKLSERHGVSLYREPEVARGILCADARDADLWPWVDPGRSTAIATAGEVDVPGIPAKTLARLVQRLEQL